MNLNCELKITIIPGRKSYSKLPHLSQQQFHFIVCMDNPWEILNEIYLQLKAFLTFMDEFGTGQKHERRRKLVKPRTSGGWVQRQKWVWWMSVSPLYSMPHSLTHTHLFIPSIQTKAIIRVQQHGGRKHSVCETEPGRVVAWGEFQGPGAEAWRAAFSPPADFLQSCANPSRGRFGERNQCGDSRHHASGGTMLQKELKRQGHQILASYRTPLTSENPRSATGPSLSAHSKTKLGMSKKIQMVKCSSPQTQKNFIKQSETIGPSGLVSSTLTRSYYPGCQAGVIPSPLWACQGVNLGPALSKDVIIKENLHKDLLFKLDREFFSVLLLLNGNN